MFTDPQSIISDVAGLLRPPRRISVSDVSRGTVRINTPGGYSGMWDPKLTPYMVEPMNLLKSRAHEAVVFVSAARAGKTQGLLDCWLAHSIIADPGDMGFYFSTRQLAYDFRKRRVARLHRHSPEIRKHLSPRSHDTTIELITYRNGMILNFGWPSSSQLAQRDLRYVALSDYDSFPDDVGGEGNPFDLAKKRVQVALSAGMALAESSPKREITTATWNPDGPHSAPPTNGGILPLYNRGDRRRWYWACIDGCGDPFEAPAIPFYDDPVNPYVACTHCGQVYDADAKPALNESGIWIPEKGRVSKIASFWQLGCASAFQSWESIVGNYIQAKAEYEISGDEQSLKATTNLDQGMPYRPKALDKVIGQQSLTKRSRDETARFYVPNEVHGMLASVDVQGDRFEVAVWGHGGDNERWLVDRFKIARTKDNAQLRPGSITEHWDLITERVVDATYRLGAGAKMRVHAVAVDSGGAEGTTEMAYAWWRRVRKAGDASRVFLVKGDGQSKNAPVVRHIVPDARKRKDRRGGRGDVPVLLLNVHKLKDACHADLLRDVPGPGYIHFPEWTPKAVFDELAAEQRTDKGWEQIGRKRNETWDLLVYERALWKHLGGDGVDWARPPPWLAERRSLNPDVIENGKQNEQKKRLNADDYRVLQ